jgi:hypothetical protein
MRNIQIIVFGTILLVGMVSAAIAEDVYVAPPTVKPGEYTADGTNGVSFKDYEGFYDKWKLITVTYRMDNNELRFAYGNAIAEKALAAGGKDYPDGAVFAKIAIITEHDQAFLNSKIPAGSMRYQFMVRDQKKYAATAGWGYALFDAAGRQYKIDERECLVCHKLVKDRNYVFSRQINLTPHSQQISIKTMQNLAIVKYSDLSPNQLPEYIRQFVPAGADQVRYMDGELRKVAFVGSLFEIRPSLIAEAIKNRKPAILVSENEKMFSLVAKADLKKESVVPKCNAGEEVYLSYWTIGFNPSSWPSKDLFCVKIE